MKKSIKTVSEVLCFAAGVMFAPFAAFAVEPAYETLISHRGESVDAPENTLPAFKTAVERGFGFECDIYYSVTNEQHSYLWNDGKSKEYKMSKKDIEF